MSIQRIDSPASNTHGWQARWPLPGTRTQKRRLTAFYSDGKHGGWFAARVQAERAEKRLKRMAKNHRGETC